MLDLIYLVVGILLGAGATFLVMRVISAARAGVPPDVHQTVITSEAVAKERVQTLESERARLEAAIISLREELGRRTDAFTSLNALEPEREATRERQGKELTEAKSDLTKVREANRIATQKQAELETTNKLLEQQILTLKETTEASNKAAKQEFENLATKIFDAKVKTLSETNSANMGQLLTPLKDKLTEFSKSVEDKYSNEAKERHTLKSKIEELVQLNEKMAKETNSLTQALRGDSKVQGDWGELVLERILEASGLRPGEEYAAQESRKDDDGDRYQPDFVINLPDGKHVVVDSKVSLTAYELSVRSEDPENRRLAVLEHVKSIRKHMDDLSEKHYSRLKGVNSPELVFMFLPIEPAYILAMQTDPELSVRAWKNNVAIVTSTTLLASLKTVSHIWRLERQNRNAQRIAEEGEKLYDKFAGFMEEFQAIGQIFEKGQRHFKTSMDRLKDGPGSVFKRLENLKELGVAPKKQLLIEAGE